MKLNPDLLREIVLNLEEDSNRYDSRQPTAEATWDEINAHLCILIDLGHIEGSVVRTFGDGISPAPPAAVINYGLSTSGHFLALEFRNDTAWNRAKEWAKKSAPSLTQAAVQSLLRLFHG